MQQTALPHEIGDFHISLQYLANLPAGAPPHLEIQGEYFRELCEIFGPTQTVIIEPPGQFGTPEQQQFAIKRTAEECISLTHTTDFIIIHGVREHDCAHLNGTWTQGTNHTNLVIIR
jgi:hypothetical protein